MKKTILVVDDVPSICTMLKKTFDMAQYDVVSAQDGTDAFKAISACQFDLVVTDIRMPNMNGEEFIKTIRERDPKVPIIIITVVAYKELVPFIEKYNVTAFFSKPFDINELVKKVRELLI